MVIEWLLSRFWFNAILGMQDFFDKPDHLPEDLKPLSIDSIPVSFREDSSMVVYSCT